MKLFDYFRSSAAYRVRIALNLKGLPYEHASINLLKGEEASESYHETNPQNLVPTLEHAGQILTQSMAICEFLDETHPEPSILPGTALERAQIRALAQAVSCDIHPINNLRVLKYLTANLGITEEQKITWYKHWVIEGFSAIESLLASSPSAVTYCHGTTPTLADICLIPQVFNARRFKVDMTPYPIINQVEEQCLLLPAFARAKPESQPDAC